MKSAIHKPQRQAGFSLIELMIALALGLVLLGGALQVFMAGKVSFNTRDGMGGLNDNARFALHLLSRDIGMAGFNGGEALQGITAATDANTGDSITVTHLAGTDCLGNTTPAGTAVNRYYIANNTLMCLGNGNVSPGPLADGIENMQILYGEDTDGDFIANRYVGSTTSGINMGNIAGVRIALLVSTNKSITTSNDATAYALLNAPPVAIASGATAGFRRKVFSTTITLRNYRRN